MKFILVLFVTSGVRAYGVTSQTRADLACLREEARGLLTTFKGGVLDTPENHRRNLAKLVDRMKAIDNREWGDPQVRELLSTLDSSVSLSIANSVEEPIRHQQIWSLFWFAVRVGESDALPWRRTRDADILASVTAAAVENVSRANPRRQMTVESERLTHLRGEITSAMAPDLGRFLAFVAASLTRVTPIQRQALLWRVIETYFDMEDQLDADCATPLVTYLKE